VVASVGSVVIGCRCRRARRARRLRRSGGPGWRRGRRRRASRWSLLDPMLAIATSDLAALPHQLKAVYDELPPSTSRRLLLADDPGAGKVIMAGLHQGAHAVRLSL